METVGDSEVASKRLFVDELTVDEPGCESCHTCK